MRVQLYSLVSHRARAVSGVYSTVGGARSVCVTLHARAQGSHLEVLFISMGSVRCADFSALAAERTQRCNASRVRTESRFLGRS